MTWFSFLTRSISLIVVLPLILSKFNQSEISLWYLFSILFGFQILADLGFGNTYTRVVSYAMAGLENLNQIDEVKKGGKRRPNWNLILAIKKKMDNVFLIVSIISISIITLIAVFFLNTPIERLDNPTNGYYLLVLILVILFFKINNNKCVALLQGLNEVALLRRWEGIIVILQISSSIIILLWTSSFNLLVINNQIWVLIGIARNIIIVKFVFNKNINEIESNYKETIIDKKEFSKHVIVPSWKGGIGIMSSYGLNQFSSFLLINYLTENQLVVYLISFRFITIISEFSRAPFYSKLPLFAQYYQLNDRDKLLSVIRKSINTATLLAVVCCLGLLVFGDLMLKLVHSKVTHLDYILWFLLSINIILERLGAMHYQAHSLSNKVIWHKANIIYGIIFMGVAYLLIKDYGLYCMPIGMLCGNIFYYTYNGIKSSHEVFGYKLISFHSKVILYTVILIIINTIFLIFTS